MTNATTIKCNMPVPFQLFNPEYGTGILCNNSEVNDPVHPMHDPVFGHYYSTRRKVIRSLSSLTHIRRTLSQNRMVAHFLAVRFILFDRELTIWIMAGVVSFMLKRFKITVLTVLWKFPVERPSNGSKNILQESSPAAKISLLHQISIATHYFASGKSGLWIS